MNCTKAEKWISDWVDGALPPGRERVLQAHLSGCSACRSYLEQVRFLNREADSLYEDAATSKIEDVLVSRLTDSLTRMGGNEQRMRASGPLPGWRWAAAIAALVLILGLYGLLQPERAIFTRPDLYPVSYEGALSEITWELEGDARLEEIFNALILNSIEDELGGGVLNEMDGYMNNPFFLNDLTEEELKLLEDELKKEKKS
jgi:hypothetical protein